MSKKKLIILFLFPTLIALGQDTTYLDYNWNEVKSIERASYYKVVVREQMDTNRATETIYQKSGQIRFQKKFSVYKDKVLDGKSKAWYKDGQIRRDVDYKDGKKNGQLLTYWTNGNPKRIDTYEKDSLIEGKCLDSNGMEVVHYDYQIEPEFPGGLDGLRQYLVEETTYPVKSRKKGIEGTVLVSFIVNKDGSVSDLKITRSVSRELDKEAMRVVKNMPKWSPGMEDGNAIRVLFTLPLKFKLN